MISIRRVLKLFSRIVESSGSSTLRMGKRSTESARSVLSAGSNSGCVSSQSEQADAAGIEGAASAAEVPQVDGRRRGAEGVPDLRCVRSRHRQIDNVPIRRW